MLFTPGPFVTAGKFCLPVQVLEAVFLWHGEACPPEPGHRGHVTLGGAVPPGAGLGAGLGAAVGTPGAGPREHRGRAPF